MPRIRCHFEDCIFLDDGYCTAAEVEIDPDQGCLTYRPASEVLGEEWEEEDILAEEDLLDEEDFLDEDEDFWDDDEL
ncbi:MAG TPA: hypothetical protein G4O04_10995 [Anaerolineae bacterium]|nr:hypothetical protein [Anaerolineae bacterium]HID83619.1 hypothetical protein [Anaerolineales bacterium]